MRSAKKWPSRTSMAENFEHELSQWRDAGQALGDAHPNLARYLTRQAHNPDIERLLEGVAFMGAQIRAHNEACAPALTQDLATMMAPWVARPLPAATLCAFVPDLKTAQGVQWVPQNTVLRGQGKQRDVRFVTRAPLAVLPIVLDNVRWQSHTLGQATLTLTLHTADTLSAAALYEHGIALYFDGPYAQASALAFAVTHHASQVTLETGGHAPPWAGHMHPLPEMTCVPLTPSFDQEPPMAHGLSQLRDAAVLPRKFCFAHVRFLGPVPPAALGSTLTLRITLAQAPGLPEQLPQDAVRLHCVPALNLAVTDAMPIRTHVGQKSHVLRPDSHTVHPQEILAIASVHSTCDATGVREMLTPHHLAVSADGKPQARWYSHLPPPPESGPHTLQVHHATDTAPSLAQATLSVRVHAHHGAGAALLPPNALQLDAPHLGALTATNVVTTTEPLAAPCAQDARFALLTLVAQRGRCQFTLHDVHTQMRLMGTAPHPDTALARRELRRLNAVTGVSTATSTRLWRGAQVLCLDICLEIDAAGFEHVGDAYFLATCLDAVWADAQPVHGVQRLHLSDKASGRSYALPLRCGQSLQGRSACALADEKRR